MRRMTLVCKEVTSTCVARVYACDARRVARGERMYMHAHMQRGDEHATRVCMRREEGGAAQKNACVGDDVYILVVRTLHTLSDPRHTPASGPVCLPPRPRTGKWRGKRKPEGGYEAHRPPHYVCIGEDGSTRGGQHVYRAREEDCSSRTARDEGSHAKMANVQMRGQRPARREDVEAGCTREAEEHVYARRARVCTQSSTMSSAQHSRARRAGRTRRSERTRGEQCERPPAKRPGRMDRTARSLARPALLFVQLF